MKNHYISYLKGIAIIFIMLVHLINWSEILPIHLTNCFDILSTDTIFRLDSIINNVIFNLKDFFHIGTLYFVTLSGSLIIIAYGKYDNLWKANKKLLKRSLLLFLIYILYSLVKLNIYDFSKEPFYQGFIDAGKFSWQGIITFRAYSVPITILLLWCMFLFITPAILYINKKFKYKKEVILGFIAILIYLNYFVLFPRNTLTEILYGENYIFYGFNLWLLPYLIGIYLGMIGFHERKLEGLIFFGTLTSIFLIYNYFNNLPILLDPYMFPLKPYFISVSFFIMFIFIYFFTWIGKFNNSIVNYSLSVLKLLGDKTLFMYITHWIVIDLTIWISRPYEIIIWITVPLYLIGFLYYYRVKILKFKNELKFGSNYLI